MNPTGAWVRSLFAMISRAFQSVRHLWRRSIQARVVLGTVVLSTVLAVLAGWILLARVSDGLLDSKQQAALSQAAAGVDTAQSKLQAAEIGDSLDVIQNLRKLIGLLSPRDLARDDYYLVFTGPSTEAAGASELAVAQPQTDIDVAATIPADLSSTVRQQPGTHWAYSTLHVAGAEPLPTLVVGSQLTVPSTGDVYSLFYLFPLDQQRSTLVFIRDALVTAEALLVVLLAVIAWLVTRQVLTPVRLARRIAERLAAGRLEERMHVRGEDDIARLAHSFNQMANNLQRQIRQLEELSRVQRRFVADVSHELRTPLTTVRMAADVLHDERDQFDPATARSAELLQTQLDRFELLLTDLLEISRFDAGAAHLELAEVDLRDVASRVIDATGPLAEQRGSPVLPILPSTPVMVEADDRRIERIIRNLVVNAVEYGEGSQVEVRVAGNGEAAAISVRDHGVGLRPGENVLVFNRFWRADPARAKTRGGTGLGLSIAVEDTELHGGKLEAWGEPGRGSLFRLTLPRRAGDDFSESPLPLTPPTRAALTVGRPYANLSRDEHRRVR